MIFGISINYLFYFVCVWGVVLFRLIFMINSIYNHEEDLYMIFYFFLIRKSLIFIDFGRIKMQVQT